MKRDIVEKYRIYMTSLMEFFNKKYKIKPYPKIRLNTEYQNDDTFGKTGYYDPEKKTVVVFVSQRFFKDVLRSFAHELVHHYQNLQGRLGKDDYSGDQITQDDKLIKLEEEAYLKGNIVFRSWTETIDRDSFKKMSSTKDDRENITLNETTIGEIIKEEICQNFTKKQPVNEVSAIMKKENPYYELIRQIYSDVLPAIEHGAGIHRKYNMTIGDTVIPIIVKTSPTAYHCWYRPSKKRIEINVCQGGCTAGSFFSSLGHEMTHAINDYNKEFKSRYEMSHEFKPYGIKGVGSSKLLDAICDILYYLWNRDERFAYTTDFFDEKGKNARIEKINNLIDYVEKFTPKNASTIWDAFRTNDYSLIKRKYYASKPIKCPDRYKNNWQTFRRFFVKKSRYLLDDLQKKMQANVNYFNKNNMNLNPDTSIMQQSADKQARKEANKASREEKNSMCREIFDLWESADKKELHNYTSIISGKEIEGGPTWGTKFSTIAKINYNGNEYEIIFERDDDKVAFKCNETQKVKKIEGEIVYRYFVFRNETKNDLARLGNAILSVIA